MTVKEGCRGRFFEDFEVGDVYKHPLGRTVTTTDNVQLTLLSQNTAPVHLSNRQDAGRLKAAVRRRAENPRREQQKDRGGAGSSPAK